MKKIILGMSTLAIATIALASCGSTKSYKNEVDYQEFSKQVTEKLTSVLTNAEYIDRDYKMTASIESSTSKKSSETGESYKYKTSDKTVIRYDKDNETIYSTEKSKYVASSNGEKVSRTVNTKEQIQKDENGYVIFNLATKTYSNTSISSGQNGLDDILQNINFSEISGAKYYVDTKGDLTVFTVSYEKEETNDDDSSKENSISQISIGKNSINIYASSKTETTKAKVQSIEEFKITCNLKFSNQNIKKLDVANFKKSEL